MRSINGLPLRAPDEAIDAYSKVKNAPTIAVDVERAGHRLVLTYVVHD